MSSRQIVVGLGGNLGARAAYLSAAVALLEACPDITLEARSPVVATPALKQPQPDFLNAAVRLRTALDPHALLDLLLEFERALGRERHERWDARTIDLDILWIGDETVQTPRLEVPHPGLFMRNFAIFPLLSVLDPEDPGAPGLRARAALLEPPRQLGTLGDYPHASVTHDTNGDLLVELTEPSDRADATAKLLQCVLDRRAGELRLGGDPVVLGTLETSLGILARHAQESASARVLVSPRGDALGLGSRYTPEPSTAMFVVSSSPLYDSSADTRSLRVCLTGATG